MNQIHKRIEEGLESGWGYQEIRNDVAILLGGLHSHQSQARREIIKWCDLASGKGWNADDIIYLLRSATINTACTFEE